MTVIKYNHHGKDVFVFEELKGKHRDMCLCFKCSKFLPGTLFNCRIAQATFDNCVKYHITTPMFECPEWDKLKNEKEDINT